jgi:hypothetical protein
MTGTVPPHNDADIQPPFYVEYGEKAREQFLSDLGNCSPAQMEVFQTLCKIWQPEIPYNKFLTQISGAIKNVAAELDRVMEKLSAKKYGLIKIRYSQGDQIRDSIILTEAAAPRFFYYAILNDLETFFNGMDGHIPYEDYLASRGANPPDARELEPGKYSVIFEEAKKNDFTIYRVVLPNKKALLLPSGGGIRFINFCLVKLREFVADTNVAAGVAAIQHISMNELNKRAESRDPLLILGVVKAIQQMRQAPVETKRLHVPEMIFNCMVILSHLISCNIEEVKRKKNAEEDLLKDKNALAHLIETEKEPLVSGKRFTELVNTFEVKYQDKFESFRKEFMEEFLTQQKEEKIPVIISIFNSYIHRSGFFQFFLSRLSAFRETAGQFTLKSMEQILRTNNKSGNSIFFSRENFDTQLGIVLRQSDPCLYEIFNNPKILSEAVIYSLKTKKKVQDIEVIQSELEKYFTSDTMQLKGLSVILHISLVDIFHRAFAQLPWWRQVLIKLSGKYQSYQEQYSRLGYNPQNPLSAHRPAGGSAKTDTAERIPEAANSSSAVSAIPQRRQKKGPHNIKKKDYTKRQQENAWNEFSKTIRPGK